MIRKWTIVNDQLNVNNDLGNQTNNTEILKSNRCDYNDTHILVKGQL